jgi:hypothetical protein
VCIPPLSAAGYYCPSSSTSAQQVECPRGAFCAAASSSPAPCSLGWYCPLTGLSTPTACPDGQQCTSWALGAGANAPYTSGDCAAGYFCTGVPVGNVSHVATVCPQGSFCPVASAAPTACMAGAYCPLLGMSTNTTCPAGSFCGASASAPTACQAGAYCDAGSSVPTSCANGQYCPYASMSAPLPCPAGFYCDVANKIVVDAVTGLVTIDVATGFPTLVATELAMLVPTGACPPAYFCPQASSSLGPVANAPAQQSIDACTVGHFCPARSGAPVPCSAGWYCAATGLSAPTGVCTEGHYCPSGSSSATQTVCPTGHYCPSDPLLGAFGAALACPAGAGTYCPQTGLTAPLPCPAGSFCASAALTAVDGSCAAGYYCVANATTATQYECPTGAYCVAGVSAPTLCVAGTYCATTGLSAAAGSGSCAAGFFCATGASSGSPAQGACAPGQHCAAGSGASTACAVGTWAPAAMMSACAPCVAGSFCAATGLSAPSGLWYAAVCLECV